MLDYALLGIIGPISITSRQPPAVQVPL